MRHRIAALLSALTAIGAVALTGCSAAHGHDAPSAGASPQTTLTSLGCPAGDLNQLDVTDKCTAEALAARICQLAGPVEMTGGMSADRSMVTYMRTDPVGAHVQTVAWGLGPGDDVSVVCDSTAYAVEPGAIVYFEQPATAASDAMWRTDWRDWSFTATSVPTAEPSPVQPAEETASEPSERADGDDTEGARTVSEAAEGFWASAIADPHAPKHSTERGAEALTAAIASATEETYTEPLARYDASGCLEPVQGPKADRVCGYLEPDTRAEFDFYVQRLDDGTYAVSGVSFYVNGGD